MAVNRNNREELAALAARLKARDREAWDTFVTQFGPKLIGYFRAYGFDYHTAEDLAQETFIETYGGIERLNGTDRLVAWLYSIARHHCVDEIKSSKNREQLSEALVGSPQMRALVDEQETGPLSALRPKDCELLSLRHLCGCSIEELASLFGLTVRAVRKRLSRAEQVVRVGHPGNKSDHFREKREIAKIVVTYWHGRSLRRYTPRKAR